MNIWLIKDGENLPIQPHQRPMRMGRLAEALQQRGHSITWWASTFFHPKKELLYDSDREINVNDRMRLKLINAGKYRRNISLRRYYQHRVFGNRIRERMKQQPAPDAIVCAFPIIEVAYAVVEYANSRNIPIIVDVQDFWPDTFLDLFPSGLRRYARIILKQQFIRTRQILKGANSIVAISEGCLEWALRYAGRERTLDDAVFHIAYPALAHDSRIIEEKACTIRESLRDKVIFVFAGTFCNAHRVELLCEAAFRAQRTGLSQFHLILAGNGERYPAIRRQVQGLGNVTMTGWLDNQQFNETLQLSHVGVAPCRMRPNSMPNKIGEYAAAGLPIISSLEGEMEEMLDNYDAGFSYKPDDLTSLNRYIAVLTQNRGLRERKTRNAQRLFTEQFDAGRITDNFATYVEGIAGGHSCRSKPFAASAYKDGIEIGLASSSKSDDLDSTNYAWTAGASVPDRSFDE